MKNTVKLFGIIALVAVIGFTMAACDGDPGDPPDEYTSELKEVTTAGRLTITGLNVYNGKKIYAPNNFKVDATIPTLTARQTAYNRYNYKNGNLDWINIEDGMFGGTIAGGQVTLKVFLAMPNEPFEGYTGNDQNVEFRVGIYDENDEDYWVNGRVTVSFTNGVASGAFVADL